MIKIVLSFFLLMCCFSLLYAQPNLPPFAVVELYTSQGCNRCPQADSVLKKIADEAKQKSKNILTIAYHVDYWNKPHKDPYSKSQFTYLQQNYVSVLKQKEMYTPMLVVNGQQCAVGNNYQQAWQMIDKQLQKAAANHLTIKQDSIKNDTLYVSYILTNDAKASSIKILLLQNNLSNVIKAGLNKSLTLHHEYVCRSYKSKSVNSKYGQVAVPLNGLRLNSDISMVGFLQHRGTLQIEAATKAKGQW